MSREKKFTPGPWGVNPVVAQVDEMPSKIPVCKMLWPTEDRSEAETEANANLISAAPELFRCCERFVEGIEAHADKALKSRMSGHLSFMKAAIKKAYGETE